jgi:hypothetical protein
MYAISGYRRVWKVTLVAVLTLIATATPRAQAPVLHRQITYIMPIIHGPVTPIEAADLRARIGEGPYVKVGFSAYIPIEMNNWNVDITNPLAVQAGLATTFATIDSWMATAQAAGLPVNFNVVTAVRAAYDPVQTASELEDRRSMQWYSTNEIAPGWWSHSRYARKARAVQEAYVREVGRYLAKKMRDFPTVLVSAAGDGEVELSYGHSFPWDSTPYDNPIIADYSPFTVAEFRDWLKNGGEYALPKGAVPGGKYAGQGYSLAARYDGDATPGTDTNGDGHTLNGDFGTNFADWELRYADWSLSDPLTGGAIPLSAPPVTDRGATHFDAPRRSFNPCAPTGSCPQIPQDAWFQLWWLFRQTMLQHHNTDFAKWITTTPVDPALPANPVSNPTVPNDRWYSYQIAADYLFGNFIGNYNLRFITGASAWTTADISPYGGLGMTAFNTNLGGAGANGPYGRTLATVLPHVKARNLRWAALEWNPSIPVSSDPAIYQAEMALVEDHRATLLVPYVWDDMSPLKDQGQTRGTQFEFQLKAMVDRIKNTPAPYVCQYGVTPVAGFVAAGGAGNISVTATAPDCAWTASSSASWLTVTSGAGTGNGTATYSVANNTGIARTATITINGRVHTVRQEAGPCVYGLSAPSVTVGYAASTPTVNVTANAGCAWTAVSNTSFVTVTGGAIGNGNGTVTLSVAAHRKHPVRSGTVTIAGQTFTVTQTGIATAFDFTGDGRADPSVFRPGAGTWFIQGGATVQYGLAGDVPVPGDYNGDTVVDVSVFRPSTGQWFINGQPTVAAGQPGDIPVPADYNGDGRTDTAVFRYVAATGPSGHLTTWVVPGQPNRTWGIKGDVPVPGDYDGDGRADLAVFRSGAWFFLYSAANYTTSAHVPLGQRGDVPVPGDYDGDGTTDVAVYRPATGEWTMMLTGSNTTAVYSWGLPGDMPVPQDIDGDGADDAAVFRPSDGMWWIFNRVTGAATSAQFGVTGDIPSAQRPRLPSVVTSDWDGDGRADMTVFRPSNGMWFTRLSRGNYDTATATQMQWGLTGDVPVVGDYDGDRRADPGVYRPAGGMWFIRYSGSSYAGILMLQWGIAGDVPYPADYDGDGRTDIAVYRPSTGQWFVRQSSTQYTTFTSTQWGLPTDVPLPADYDGDGRADLAVYRPSTQQWFVRLSTTGGSVVKQWGLAGDQPVAADFDGDGRADLGVYRPATGQWIGVDMLSRTATAFVLTVNAAWGLPGDIVMPRDFDGDGTADAAVYRPSTGEWFVTLPPPVGVIHRQWGLPGDIPLLTVGGGGPDR